MKWILPMAGKGTRTLELGEFKPFIEIKGKKIIEWLLLSIRNNIKEHDKIIFITTNYFKEKYSVKETLTKIMNKINIHNSAEFIFVEKTPPGPAASVYESRIFFEDKDESATVVNTDQYITFELPEINEKEVCLPVYAEFGNKSSYVEIKKANKIKKVVEKKNISNIASAGVYIVSSGHDLMKAIKKQFEKKETYKDEYYVGPSLNNLIEMNYKLFPIKISAKYNLGNINGIKLFEKVAETMR